MYGGDLDLLYYTNYPSPLGSILLLASEEALTGLWLPGQSVNEKLLAQAIRQDHTLILEQGCDWLDRYFRGLRPSAEEIPLAPQGSAFRRKVWQRLCRIPYGQLETYGHIAREIAAEGGGKMSAQAVGGAVGHNPISLIIPCHRVVGTNGSLVGYNGGLSLKKRLLQLEGVDMRMLHDP